ncbi:MAG TPA: porin [Ignavibacteriales bacterium]|nr:porin [Ignavibacteriales bacterium]HOL81413.1 porin [Ignavibacteriales bacterium]HOM65527.1 porin [Ignavibacteriales bacterium]HPP34357.1 porin [Ignavibacteriales bacterium]HRR18548.1 porin [Ignavibacteriales bacterium]
MKKFQVMLFLLMFSIVLFAQETNEEANKPQSTVEEKIEELKGQVEGMNENLIEMQNTLNSLSKMKISGYIQADFKNFDNAQNSYDMRNRFNIRRGRLKFTYTSGLTQFVYQFQASEDKVESKDLYMEITDPWIKSFKYTMGLFVRPFGFETPFSSSSMEYPERAKVVTTMLPGEEDLGAMISYETEKGPLSFLNFKAGLFTGNGIKSETDNLKDIMGRLGYKFAFDEANFAIDGGFSFYLGNVRPDVGKNVIELNPSNLKVKSGEKTAERTYFGADIQLYFNLPVVEDYLGGSILRAEVITGKHPGTSSSTSYYTVGSGDVYLREFLGYYICFVQNIGLSNQFVVKYDVYDPNTKVSGDDLGKTIATIGTTTYKTNKADVMYSQLGLGWVHHWSPNVKFTLYYDMITNEKSANLSGFEKDIKDNTLTFRMQYSF